MRLLCYVLTIPGNVELKAEGVEAVAGGRKGMCGDCCAVAPFRRNALDTFLLRALPDTGDIKQIEIGHDDAGSGSGKGTCTLGVHSHSTEDIKHPIDHHRKPR